MNASRRPPPWALGLLTAAVVAGSWGVGAPAAFAVGEPITTPVITAPTDTATVAGDVQITATSTAPFVQFYVDAAPLGSPVAATGTAMAVWSTYGLANSSSHALTAADCNANGCNTTQSTVVTVTVNNTAPAITSPVNGATTDRTLTVNATAPGGGVAFTVDGNLAAFDGSAPYSFVIAGPLAEGAHSVGVQECDATGATCNGPTATSSFTVVVLHPAVGAVSPNPFSPNNDGVRDKTTFRIHLSDFENVTFAIQNGNGQTIKGPYALGRLSPGSHSYGWNGKGNAGKTASTGTYTILVNTSAIRNNATVHGVASTPVKIDLVGPVLSHVSGNGVTFYPFPDGFHDGFRTTVRVNEGGGLWLKIYNVRGAEIREYSHGHGGAGTYAFIWNGRDAHGSLMRAGTYRFLFKATDSAGNRRGTRSFRVTVRGEHLVNRSVVLSRDGDSGTVQSSDWSCTQYNYTSNFAHGVWLDNVCDPYYDGDQAIWAVYSFGVPGAVRYNSIRVQSYGTPVVNAPEAIAATIYNFSQGQWVGVGGVYLPNDQDPRWSTYGTRNAAGLVRGGQVRVTVGVPNVEYLEDYDIGAVAITVSYAVLTR